MAFSPIPHRLLRDGIVDSRRVRRACRSTLSSTRRRFAFGAFSEAGR